MRQTNWLKIAKKRPIQEKTVDYEDKRRTCNKMKGSKQEKTSEKKIYRQIKTHERKQKRSKQKGWIENSQQLKEPKKENQQKQI